MCLERRSRRGDSGTRDFRTRVLARRDFGDKGLGEQGILGQGILATRELGTRDFEDKGNLRTREFEDKGTGDKGILKQGELGDPFFNDIITHNAPRDHTIISLHTDHLASLGAQLGCASILVVLLL
jgi:hypothetical protein